MITGLAIGLIAIGGSRLVIEGISLMLGTKPSWKPGTSRMFIGAVILGALILVGQALVRGL